MAVTIRVLETSAVVDNGIWHSGDTGFVDMLAQFDTDNIIGYTPWSDYRLAEIAVESLGGRIIKATDRPDFVDGRIY